MNTIRLNTIGTPCKAGGGGNSGGGDTPSGGGSQGWIIAVPKENYNNEDVVLTNASLSLPMFFPKGDNIQIMQTNNGHNIISTPTDAPAQVINSGTIVGSIVKVGAVMNDFGDGKVRQFNSVEDYKSILLELCSSSGYSVTMEDIDSSISFMSIDELFEFVAYGTDIQ